METRARDFRLASMLLGVYLAAAAGAAQTYEVVHSFVVAGGRSAGPLVYSVTGALYGTTQDGGAFARGSVYSLTPDGSGGFTFLTVYSFRGPDGATPQSALIFGADGNLYGTTHQGGAAGAGTIFRLEPSGSLTRLHDFADGGGRFPTELILASDGAFWGTASYGGDHDEGTVFRLGPDEDFSTVHSFDSTVEGSGPAAGLLQVGGDLYGTTGSGGTGGFGTAFRVDLMTGALTTIHNFTGADGSAPVAALIQGVDGNLYGTTSTGGPSDVGTVFRMDLSGTLTSLHSFQFIDGIFPAAPLFQASDGKFYGTTKFGGGAGGKDWFPEGSAFRMDALGNFQQLYAFQAGNTPTPGLGPEAGFADGHDGYLYATTLQTSVANNEFASGPGSVYRIDLAGSLSYVYFFEETGPFFPVGPLTEANGALYGTTNGNGGTLFRLDGSDATVLHQFTGADGSDAFGGLLLASDGDLYGTASKGGSGGSGTTFRLNLSSSGTFETLHEFLGTDGAYPFAGLVESPVGELYGTTGGGGDLGFGTVFHMDTSGTITTLHSFDNADGNYAYATLIRGEDGNLYSTTLYGGAAGVGTIFSMDALGAFSSLHEFASTDGASPHAGLLQATDGDFYGVTTNGGMSDQGTIYRLDGSGALTTLHTFTGPDGSTPSGTLIQAADGMLYGTAYLGGANNLGTIYRTDTLGNVSLLHEFDGSSGSKPYAHLLEASDGAFYGTATEGGFAGTGSGVVFRWLPDVATPAVTGIGPSSGRAAGGTPVAVSGDHLYSVTSISIGGTAATPPVVPDQGTIFTVSPALAPGTLNDVTVDLTHTLASAWFANFTDVAQDDIFHSYVETIFRDGITAGCGAGNYCRNTSVTRAQMAVFLLKAEHGSAYLPPACANVFPDVPCPSPFADWIEQLAAEGVTAGCGGGNYCPGDPVTRRQMAVFLLKTKEGSSYTPPPAVGVFDDVPQADAFAPWIEEIYARQITGGCLVSPLLYCPANPNTRGQMAVFLVKTFGL